MSASDKKFLGLIINVLGGIFLLGAAIRALVIFLKSRPQLRAGDKVRVAPAPTPTPVNKKREVPPMPVNGVQA